MEELNEFFNKEFTYAIVGASNNREKYGNKIFRTLLEANFKVIPINPKEEFIEEIKAYKNLTKVPINIDIVDFVVPPKITLEVLEEVKSLNIKKVWLQPKTFNKDVILFLKKNKIKYLKDFCLLESTLKYLKKN